MRDRLSLIWLRRSWHWSWISFLFNIVMKFLVKQIHCLLIHVRECSYSFFCRFQNPSINAIRVNMKGINRFILIPLSQFPWFIYAMACIYTTFFPIHLILKFVFLSQSTRRSKCILKIHHERKGLNDWEEFERRLPLERFVLPQFQGCFIIHLSSRFPLFSSRWKFHHHDVCLMFSLLFLTPRMLSLPSSFFVLLFPWHDSMSSFFFSITNSLQSLKDSQPFFDCPSTIVVHFGVAKRMNISCFIKRMTRVAFSSKVETMHQHVERDTERRVTTGESLQEKKKLRLCFRKKIRKQIFI